jgi:uncharacterized protein YecT (DUF1311 family)
MQFRTAQCNYVLETSQGGTGTLAGYAETKCEAQITEARETELQRELKNLAAHSGGSGA